MIVASFHVASFKVRRSLSKLVTVPAERWELSATPGCRLGKVLGTSARNTTRVSADIGRWAIFAVWDDEKAHRNFLETSPLIKRWMNSSHLFESYLLAPISSKGSWSGVNPFAGAKLEGEESGQIAVVTRASVRWRKLMPFSRAIPAVDDSLKEQTGCREAMGVGEWPVGQQATFSVWDSPSAIKQFAYRSKIHSDVIKRTHTERWYSEEMFSRFQVIEKPNRD